MGSAEKHFIVPIFLPNIGCPHQCVFCNQVAITGKKQNLPSPEQIHSWVNEFLKYKGEKRKNAQISFYGGNFLGLKKNLFRSILHEATKFVRAGAVDSIRFSTRPDTINKENLYNIKDFPVATIELGVQSMDDQVLSMSQRGHTSLDTKEAVNLLKKEKYEIGLQMMVGLPGDDESKSLTSGDRIADLSPDFVRIYPTVVLENSLLAKWYKDGKYTPPSFDACISLVKKLYILFKEKDIQVVRMGLQISNDLDKDVKIIAGPYHPAFGHIVYSELFLDMVVAAIKSENVLPEILFVKVNPKSISKMRGLKNKNIITLKNKFNIKSLEIISDPSLAEDTLTISDSTPSFKQR